MIWRPPLFGVQVQQSMAPRLGFRQMLPLAASGTSLIDSEQFDLEPEWHANGKNN